MNETETIPTHYIDPQGNQRRTTGACAIALIAVVAALAYVSALWNGLVWDDIQLLSGDIVTGKIPWWRAFFEDYWKLGKVWSDSGGYYRPLTILSLRLDQVVGGGDPLFFHLTSVVLHVVTSLLVYPLALRSGLSSLLALCAALLFAAHPHHAETVAWISGRPDLLYTAALFAALVLSGPASYLFGICALLSKETAVVWPIVAICVERRAFTGSRFIQVLLVGGYLAVRHAVLGENGTRLMALDFSTGLRAALTELGTWIAPPLTPYAYTPILTWREGPLVMWLGIPVAVYLLVVFTRSREARPSLVSAATIHAPAAILMSSTLVLGMRPLYSASAFMIVAIVFSLKRYERFMRGWRWLGIAFLVPPLMWGTMHMTQRWSDDLSFQQKAAEENPNSPRVQVNLAVAQKNAGLLLDCWDTTSRSLALGPHPGIPLIRGEILERIGCTANALQEYRMSVRIMPGFVPSYHRLWKLLTMYGTPNEIAAFAVLARNHGVSFTSPMPPSTPSHPAAALRCSEAEIRARLLN